MADLKEIARTIIKSGLLPSETECLMRDLLQQIEDAELALKVWDTCRDSEYWLRYPSEPGDFVASAITPTDRETRP